MRGRIVSPVLLALLLIPGAHAGAATKILSVDGDPCVDPGEDDLAKIVVWDDQCTYRADVTFERTEEGFNVTIVVEVARLGTAIVLSCAKAPDVPRVGVPHGGLYWEGLPCRLDRTLA